MSLSDRTISRRQLPKISAHFAMTADGKISTKNFTPSRFTSANDKSRLHSIRAAHDAILVGRGTVEADTMSMGLSRADLRAERVGRGLPPEPLRVVISNEGRLDSAWKVFQYQSSPLVVLSTTRMPDSTREGIAVYCDLHLFDADQVPLRAAMAMLKKDYGIRSLVCEGGGQLLKALAMEDLLDAIHLTIAPVVFGGMGAPTLTGIPRNFLPQPVDFRIAAMETNAGECYVHLTRRRLNQRRG